jgi:hypothetical protein
MDNPETLTILCTQDTGRRRKKIHSWGEKKMSSGFQLDNFFRKWNFYLIIAMKTVSAKV